MSTLKIPVTSQDHIQGDASAPIILVEYGDYQCPHCGMAYPIVKRVQKHFDKRMAFVFRNFPLNEIHPEAESAAEAAEFAAVHGKFWEMHDGIFKNQEQLSESMLADLAENLGLASSALAKSLAKDEFTERVRSDFMGGVRSGVNGTPTFFINGERHNGPFDLEDLIAAIEDQLA